MGSGKQHLHKPRKGGISN